MLAIEEHQHCWQRIKILHPPGFDSTAAYKRSLIIKDVR
jgi:hypothetical protein